MSTAELNVWITDFGDFCHIEDKDRWLVHIVDCEGKVVEWCGKRFRDIPAKCGHAEIKIPPGCYAVFASHSREGEGVGEFGNRLTHVQVVRANCGDHVCVTLFSPTMWFCGTWFAYAVGTQVQRLERAQVDPRIARTAVQAVQALLEKIPEDAFTANMRREFGGDYPNG